MGVKKAIDNVLDAANRSTEKGGGGIYVDGPVIHNPQVISLLEQKGIKVLEKETCLSEEDTVIIRAHGVPPEREQEFKQHGCRVINSTCPLVARIQEIIAREKAEGKTILIIGDKGHPEVIGLSGYAGGQGRIIETAQDLDGLDSLSHVAVVAQSTQDTEKFGSIVAEITERFPDAEVYDTICRATKRRQESVKELAGTCDALVVVGGKNSGNTKRLAEIASGTVPVFHVETADELDTETIGRYSTVGIAGGASTPNWIIIRVKERLEAISEQTGSFTVRLFKRIYRFTVYGHIMTACAGASLSAVFFTITGYSRMACYSTITFLYIFAMHTFNRFLSYNADRFNAPDRAFLFARSRNMFLTAGTLSLAAAAGISWAMGTPHLLAICLFSVPGIIYPLNMLPASFENIVRYRSLRDVPGSKDIAAGLGWAFIIVLFPSITAPGRLSLTAGILFVLIFFLAGIRSVLFDILDIPGDRITGNDTLPILLGFKRTRYLLGVLIVITSVILGLSAVTGLLPVRSTVLFIPAVYLAAATAGCTEKAAYYPALFGGIIELSFIVTAAAALFTAG